jgi:lysophospholipase L1-like esterase
MRRTATPINADAWVRQVFNALDENGDGLLNEYEMPAALQVGLARWNRNGDGLITFGEFQQFAHETGQALLLGEVHETLVHNAQVAAANHVAAASAAAAANHAAAVAAAAAHAAAAKLAANAATQARLAAVAQQLHGQGLTGAWLGVLTAGRKQGPPRAPLPALPNAHQAVVRPAARPPLALPNRAVPRASPVLPARAALPHPLAPAPTPVYPDYMATLPFPISGTTNAYLTEREIMNEELVARGHVPVLFLGDSITDWFATGAGKPVWQAWFSPLGAEDFAVAGVTTSQVLWQLQAGQVAAVSPDVAVLMIGTNNLGGGQTPQAVVKGISAIVDGITAESPNSKVLLLGILPRGFSPADPLRAQIAQVNASLASLDDGKQVHFLDIGHNFLQSDGTISPAVMADGLHPTLYGYQVMTASIWQPVVDLIRGN